MPVEGGGAPRDAPEQRDAFLSSFEGLPGGFFTGRFRGRAYGVTVHRSADGRRARLFAEELGGFDYVSFNLYRLADGSTRLKPCEMPDTKVRRFVEELEFVPAGG